MENTRSQTETTVTSQQAARLRAADALIASAEQHIHPADYSLYGGLPGLVLYYGYRARLDDNSLYQQRFLDTVQKCMEQGLAQTIRVPSLAGGYFGTAWLLAHLLRNNLVDLEDEEGLLRELSDKAYSDSLASLEANNLDLLHGAAGALLYFQEIDQYPFARQRISGLSKALLDKAHQLDEHAWWENTADARSNPEGLAAARNTSFAHGTSGLIKLLLGLLDFPEVDQPRLRALLHRALTWLAACQSPSPATCSRFPDFAPPRFDERYYRSRLAWCYGDLTIGLTLIDAGLRLDSNWSKLGREVIAAAAGRETFDQTLVDENTFCHGAAGLAHCFEWVYRKTGEPEAGRAAAFWLNRTLMPDLDNVALNQSKPALPGQYGLLCGNAGVALTLLASIDWKLAGWNRCLNLA